MPTFARCAFCQGDVNELGWIRSEQILRVFLGAQPPPQFRIVKDSQHAVVNRRDNCSSRSLASTARRSEGRQTPDKTALKTSILQYRRGLMEIPCLHFQRVDMQIGLVHIARLADRLGFAAELLTAKRSFGALSNECY
jgi:hypothetical protein